MIKLFWSGMLFLLLLTGCGSGGTATRENDFTPLTSINVSTISPTIAMNTSAAFTATGDFSGLFTRDVTDKVVWKSSNPAVADFTNSNFPNRIFAKAPGITILTATRGNVTGTYPLRVTLASITSITITPANPSVAKGLQLQLAAVGTFTDAFAVTTTQDITFDAVWSSGTSSIATVSDVAGSKGLTQGIAAGTSTITATFGGVSGNSPLNVTEAVLQSISVTPSSTTILSLSTMPAGTFKASGKYSDGTTVDISAQVTWSSTQPTVATAAAGGAVSTLKAGATSITASLGSVAGSSSLKVNGGTLSRIDISGAPTINMIRGGTQRIIATGTFDNGGIRDVTSFVEWTPANTNLATVTLDSGVRWLNAVNTTQVGTPTKITAKIGSVAGSVDLNVTEPTLNPGTLVISGLITIAAGSTSQLKLEGTFSDGQIRDLTQDTNTVWSSGDDSIAKVANSGLTKGSITGVAANSTPAVIKATYNGEFATVNATVKALTVQSIAVTPGSANLNVGSEKSFKAEATFNDGSKQDVTRNATWSINKPTVVSLANEVTDPGRVVGVDVGTAALTATFNGISSNPTANITVTP